MDRDQERRLFMMLEAIRLAVLSTHTGFSPSKRGELVEISTGLANSAHDFTIGIQGGGVRQGSGEEPLSGVGS